MCSPTGAHAKVQKNASRAGVGLGLGPRLSPVKTPLVHQWESSRFLNYKLYFSSCGAMKALITCREQLNEDIVTEDFVIEV